MSGGPREAKEEEEDDLALLDATARAERIAALEEDNESLRQERDALRAALSRDRTAYAAMLEQQRDDAIERARLFKERREERRREARKRRVALVGLARWTRGPKAGPLDLAIAAVALLAGFLVGALVHRLRSQ